MKLQFKIFVLSLSLIVSITNAQTNKQTPETNASVLLTADSLASGNYKDILSSFYQLGITNLTGPNKELHFTSNPFAIMLRHNPSLAEDANYMKPVNQFWRRLNFDLNAKLDSAYRFNGFSLGINYSILNKRDVSISKAFSTLAQNDPNDLEYAKLLKDLRNRILKDYNPEIKNKQESIKTLTLLKDSLIASHVDNLLISKLDDSLENIIKLKEDLINSRDLLLIQENNAANDTTFTFDKLHPRLQAMIKQIAQDSSYVYVLGALKANQKLNIATSRNKGYHDLIKSFQNKPLWTLTISDTSYNTGQLFKSIQISTEFLKGIMNPNGIANLELNIKAYTSFMDDTLHLKKDLNRVLFNFEPGVNLVLKGKRDTQPYMEFKLSRQYSNLWKGSLYKDEPRINSTLNATLRFRVLNEIWIPLEIKYDTKNQNLFGFLNVTCNFKALGNILNPKK